MFKKRQQLNVKEKCQNKLINGTATTITFGKVQEVVNKTEREQKKAAKDVQNRKQNDCTR